jgi:hypothetical protein
MTCVVTPCVRILMGVGMVVVMIVRVAMRVRMVMRMLVRGAALYFRVIAGKYVNLGARDAAPNHLPHVKPRTNVQRRNSFRKHFEWHTGIDQSAEKHVTADAGKAIEKGYAHRFECNCNRCGKGAHVR